MKDIFLNMHVSINFKISVFHQRNFSRGDVAELFRVNFFIVILSKFRGKFGHRNESNFRRHISTLETNGVKFRDFFFFVSNSVERETVDLFI